MAIDAATVRKVARLARIGKVVWTDVVTEGGDPDKVLGNAPKTAKGFFIVPKVVE